MCCRTSSCSLVSCLNQAGETIYGDLTTTKCDGVVEATYQVPSDATSISVQVHDGALGGDPTFAGCKPGPCTTRPEGVCGGVGNGKSCAAATPPYKSNACLYAISLEGCTATCSQAQIDSCSTYHTTQTGDAACKAYTCQVDAAEAAGYKCVASPTAFQSSSTMCRASAGDCDMAD